MAKEDKSAAVPAPQKHVLTILDANGKTAVQDMMKLNNEALAVQAGSRAKRKAIVRQISEIVNKAMARV